MKKTKYLIYLFIVILVILSICYGIAKIIRTNVEVEQSLSTEYIIDEKIVSGFESEKQRIKLQEKKKVIVGEVIVLALSVSGVILIDKKMK